MSLELIPTIKMLSDLVQSAVTNVDKFRGTAKQRFGKSLISLLDILEEAQESISETLEVLDEINGTKPGSKRHDQVMWAIESSKGIEDAYHRLDSWMNKNAFFPRALDMLYPITSTERLFGTITMDSALLDRGEIATTSQLSKRIQSLENRLTKSSLIGIKRISKESRNK